MSADELLAKINYLKYNNIPLINTDGKLNNLLCSSTDKMKSDYGIDKKELINNYLNLEEKNNVL
jgi:hypothetical protein